MRESGIFFKVLVQVVILFGLDMWVMTPYMGPALWISRTGCTIVQQKDIRGGFGSEDGNTPLVGGDGGGNMGFGFGGGGGVCVEEDVFCRSVLLIVDLCE